ncbi:MAG: serine/threonine protein kinase [Tomitella sp.]|nr:serine/threonine protein kinase [Tomitella sp.]
MKFLAASTDPIEAAEDRQRFAREVRCQSMLHHSGIMPITRYDVEANPPWYSMPKADLVLTDLVGQQGSLTPQQTLAVMSSIFEAIEYAHSEGILHRDVKPENILRLPYTVAGSSGWVVADFGLCRDEYSASTRITRTHTAVGTIAFMAPEQFDDAHEVDGTADVYALGKVIAYCLTGRRPFPTVKWDEIPLEFRHLIRRCIAENPRERFQTVAELRTEALIVGYGPRDDLANPLEEAKRLLPLISEQPQSVEAASKLVHLLSMNADDEHLHVNLIPLMLRPTLSAMQGGFPAEYALIIRDFDRHTNGSFGFSFTDHISNLFESVYLLTDDDFLRRVAARRILLTGYNHNRYYVRSAFCRIASVAEGVEAAMIAGLLRELPDCAEFIATVGNQGYAPVIRDALFPPPF